MKQVWAKIIATGLSSLGLSLGSLLPASAAIQQLFTFGDSLSDVGNVYKLTGERFPQSPPYQDGRFSNGPLWIDWVSQDLKLNPIPVTDLPPSVDPIPADGINFAVGGATSGTFNIYRNLNYPGLPQQVQGFLRRLGDQPANPDALYMLLIGGNDYLGETPQPLSVALQRVAEVTQNISIALETLMQAGAQDFLVFNLPDLGQTPSGQTVDSEYLTQLTLLHNRLLQQRLVRLQQRYPTAQIQLVDFYALAADVIQNPKPYGFTNVTDACLDSATLVPCRQPDEYLFWDGNHPTRIAHQFLAERVFDLLPNFQSAGFSVRAIPYLDWTAPLLQPFTVWAEAMDFAWSGHARLNAPLREPIH